MGFTEVEPILKLKDEIYNSFLFKFHVVYSRLGKDW